MSLDFSELYQLSKESVAKGTRRLAREKALQVIMAKDICGEDMQNLFAHIMGRKFNFGDYEEPKGRLLKPSEIYELESDKPINWKPEDKQFGQELVRRVIANREELDKLIDKYAKNWELERIAQLDRILLQMATVELLFFPEIPPKVSINEAIDISKKFSTDKSKVFVNGILDSILEELKKDNRLNKSGRGLNEGLKKRPDPKKPDQTSRELDNIQFNKPKSEPTKDSNTSGSIQ
jgi:N utilization substance protein B